MLKDKYKLSKYNYTKIVENVCIYNTFTGAVIILNKCEYDKFIQFYEFNEDDADINTWINQGLIIPNTLDETAMVNYNRARDTFTQKTATYRILTTTCCNARCFYCYEDGIQPITMTIDIANRVADFIINKSRDKKRIALNWFGGEPLLNPDIITIITQKIESGLKNNDVKISSSLVTNASLFTDDLIQLANNIWKIKNVQISLDGMCEVHETRKNYINYSPSFDKTIKVISSLLYNNMNVSLRLNYDKDNINSIISLIHFIKDKFGKYSTLKCYAYPLFSNGSNAYEYINTDYEVKKYENIIKDNLLECGFIDYTKMPQMRTTSCFATNPYSYVINANGDLYKCSLNMSPKEQIGNVTSRMMASDIIMKWCNPILPQECNNCIILPICQGGCRANNVLSLNQPYCNIKLNAIDWALTKILTKH